MTFISCKMEKPWAIKPSIPNAILPNLLRNFFYAIVIGLVVYGIAWLLRFFKLIPYSDLTIKSTIISLAAIFAIIPLLVKIIVLYNTTYYIFKTHIVSEMEFIKVIKHTVPYSQITDMAVDVSIWDRICRAGDIVLHTGNEQRPSLKLQYIKNVQDVERIIHSKISKGKTTTSS